MTRVRGAGTFAGARRSGALWLGASPCVPLVGGRAERPGLDGLAGEPVTPVAIRGTGWLASGSIMGM